MRSGNWTRTVKNILPRQNFGTKFLDDFFLLFTYCTLYAGYTTQNIDLNGVGIFVLWAVWPRFQTDRNINNEVHCLGDRWLCLRVTLYQYAEPSNAKRLNFMKNILVNLNCKIEVKLTKGLK